jgi:hypothetical protein
LSGNEKIMTKRFLIIASLIIGGFLSLNWSQTIVLKTLLKGTLLLNPPLQTNLTLCYLTPFPPSLKVLGLSVQSLNPKFPFNVEMNNFIIRFHELNQGGIDWTIAGTLPEGSIEGSGTLFPFHLKTQLNVTIRDFDLTRINGIPLANIGLGFSRGRMTLESFGTVGFNELNLNETLTLSSVRYFSDNKYKIPKNLLIGLSMTAHSRSPFHLSFKVKGSLFSPKISVNTGLRSRLNNLLN